MTVLSPRKCKRQISRRCALHLKRCVKWRRMCDGRKQCSKGLRVVRLLKRLLHAKAALLLKLDFLQHADLVCAVSACRPVKIGSKESSVCLVPRKHSQHTRSLQMSSVSLLVLFAFKQADTGRRSTSSDLCRGLRRRLRDDSRRTRRIQSSSRETSARH